MPAGGHQSRPDWPMPVGINQLTGTREDYGWEDNGASWAGSLPAGFSIDTNVFRSGTRSLRYDRNVTTDVNFVRSTNVSLPPKGRSCVIGCWVRFSNDFGGRAQLRTRRTFPHAGSVWMGTQMLTPRQPSPPTVFTLQGAGSPGLPDGTYDVAVTAISASGPLRETVVLPRTPITVTHVGTETLAIRFWLGGDAPDYENRNFAYQPYIGVQGGPMYRVTQGQLGTLDLLLNCGTPPIAANRVFFITEVPTEGPTCPESEEWTCLYQINDVGIHRNDLENIQVFIEIEGGTGGSVWFDDLFFREVDFPAQVNVPDRGRGKVYEDDFQVVEVELDVNERWLQDQGLADASHAYAHLLFFDGLNAGGITPFEVDVPLVAGQDNYQYQRHYGAYRTGDVVDIRAQIRRVADDALLYQPPLFRTVKGSAWEHAHSNLHVDHATRMIRQNGQLRWMHGVYYAPIAALPRGVRDMRDSPTETRQNGYQTLKRVGANIILDFVYLQTTDPTARGGPEPPANDEYQDILNSFVAGGQGYVQMVREWELDRTPVASANQFAINPTSWFGSRVVLPNAFDGSSMDAAWAFWAARTANRPYSGWFYKLDEVKERELFIAERQYRTIRDNQIDGQGISSGLAFTATLGIENHPMYRYASDVHGIDYYVIPSGGEGLALAEHYGADPVAASPGHLGNMYAAVKACVEAMWNGKRPVITVQQAWTASTQDSTPAYNLFMSGLVLSRIAGACGCLWWQYGDDSAASLFASFNNLGVTTDGVSTVYEGDLDRIFGSVPNNGLDVDDGLGPIPGTGAGEVRDVIFEVGNVTCCRVPRTPITNWNADQFDRLTLVPEGTSPASGWIVRHGKSRWRLEFATPPAAGLTIGGTFRRVASPHTYGLRKAMRDWNRWESVWVQRPDPTLATIEEIPFDSVADLGGNTVSTNAGSTTITFASDIALPDNARVLVNGSETVQIAQGSATAIKSYTIWNRAVNTQTAVPFKYTPGNIVSWVCRHPQDPNEICILLGSVSMQTPNLVRVTLATPAPVGAVVEVPFRSGEHRDVVHPTIALDGTRTFFDVQVQPLQARAGTLSSSGTTCSTTEPHELQPGDGVVLTSGPQSGQRRFFFRDTLGSRSFPLKSAFTANQSGASYAKQAMYEGVFLVVRSSAARVGLCTDVVPRESPSGYTPIPGGPPPPPAPPTQVALRGVGTAAATDGASAPAPAIPASAQAGDVLELAFYCWDGTDAEVSVPTAGWTQVYNHLSTNGLIALWRAQFTPGMPNPTIVLTNTVGGTFGDTALARIVAYRNVNFVVPQVTSVGEAASSQNIGPIPGSGLTVPPRGAVIMHGGKRDDWTSVDTPQGDGLAWLEISEADATSGRDAGMALAMGVNASDSPVSLSEKTFTVIGGTAVGVKGVMHILEVTP